MIAQGSLVAGRYELGEPLGQGGFGRVFRATDKLTGARVAVKVLHAGGARARREVMALRLLDVPGVVHLLDEGEEEGCELLVMEHVDGAPFPGALMPAPWPLIASASIGLLETLSRIHAAGVVHRDIKPANVLVTREGRPVLLDFGLSHITSPVGDGLTRDGEMLGTAEYLAPEQINGDPVTPRTDLYSVGVLLYAALSGRLPHEARDLQGLLRARLIRRPTPLADAAPGVPRAVANVVDRLLSVDPAERPRSAAEVLALLRGERALTASQLPFLGPRAVIEALVTAALAGEARDLHGPKGSGRTRCLEEVEAALVARGRRVVWVAPGRRALSSVEPCLGSLDEHAHHGLSEVVRAAEGAIRGMLRAGVVILADDAASMDRTSARLLARCAHEGAVIRVLDGDPSPGDAAAVAIAPLGEVPLRALFTGVDRLFHTCEDAARALYERTDGLPAKLAHELAAWERAGLARVDGERWAVSREALDRLEGGARVASAIAAPPALLPHLVDLLDWVSLAWPFVPQTLLPDVMGQPPWRVEAEVDELIEAGAARRLSDGRIEPLVSARVEERWTDARRTSAHEALAKALPEGAPGRLLQLMACGEAGSMHHERSAEIAKEALALSRRLAHEGFLRRATTALTEGLMIARRADPPPEAEILAMLALSAEIAIAEATPSALDRALYELSRAPFEHEAIPHLTALVRAAGAFGSGGQRGLSAARAVAPFEDVGLERRRLGLAVMSARRCSRADEEAMIDEVGAWAARSGDEGKASLAAWLGRLRYRQGRFEESAALHAEAASLAPWRTERIFERLAAASSAMEAFQLSQSAEWAREALVMARACRHVYFEARAEWLLRATAYRSGQAMSLDRELCDVIEGVGVADLSAIVWLTEAAVALRLEAYPDVVSLAERARRVWASLGMDAIARFARCSSIRAGSPLEEGEIAGITAWALTCDVPGLGLQSLALLAAGGAAIDAPPSAIARLAAEVPEPQWDVRMDVLSVRECLALLRGDQESAT